MADKDLVNEKYLTENSGVIYMNAPASTTLTDEEYAKITSGKIVKIKGTFLGMNNITLFPPVISGNNVRGSFIGNQLDHLYQYWCLYFVNVNTKVISTPANGFIQLAGDSQEVRIFGSNVYIKGKLFPDYPSSPANNKIFTYKTNNTLAWADISTFLQEISGYDETKTQVLKNVNGTFTWVDE